MTLRLLASYLALTVVVLLALEVPLALSDARSERQDLTAKVERDAFAAASLSEDVLQANATSPSLRRTAAAYLRDTGGRLVIVNRHGISIADSKPTFPGERNFASRPEIAAALRTGRTVTGIRYSAELHTRLLYVAVPVASSGRVLGAVRITYPTSALDHRVNRFRLLLAGVGAIVVVAAALIGLLLARSIAEPLRRVEAVAARIGGGDLEARAAEHDGPPEVQRLAVELNRSTAKLAVLIAQQEQFVADASHELRTPLTALRLRLETGDTEGALAEAERLARIVDDLLALARFDSSGATEVDLAALAAERARQWEPLAAEHGVRLVSVGDGARVQAGPGRVAQVLDNLLANAIDAAPAGSAVTIRADGKELHVVDAGAGLSDEERVRAFDRFWTKGKRGGSGLGLAIARRLVQVDGGTIELRAAEGGGTDAAVTY